MKELSATARFAPSAGPAEVDRHFRTDHLLGDLKGRSVRGGAVTLTSQVIKFVLQTGSTMVLARLLTPDDFGLLAMVVAVTGLVAMFKDAGLSMATVQRADINQSQVSTLFWINVALSIGVMFILAALAPLIAWFYGEPRLLGIALALAAISIFGGLAVQHQALLRRQMRFRDLAIIEILSMVAGIVTAILMATAGFGYWSLVGLTAAAAMATCALVWWFSGWRPGRPVRGSGVRSMLHFGAHFTGFNLVNYLARNFDNVLIGWWWGASSLGVYSRAYGLLLQPIRQIGAPLSAVVLPALSRVQHDPERFRRISLRLLRITSTVGCPAAVIVTIFADEIVHLLLGPGWDKAIPIVRWLSIACVVQIALNQVGNLFIAQGRADLLFRFGVVNSLLALASFVVGLPWGALGVAAAYSMSGLLIRSPILLAYLGRTGRFSQRELYGAIAPAVAVGFVASAFALSVPLAMEDASRPPLFLAATALGLVVWYIASYWFIKSCRLGVIDVISLLSNIRTKKAPE